MADLQERFAAAWLKHKELTEDLQQLLVIDSNSLNDWAREHVAQRSTILQAIAVLLNQQNEAGLVMLESWLEERKRHGNIILQLAKANDAVRFYREWMANRGGKLDPDTPYIDHAYIRQLDAKFQKFIKYRYWTFGDEKYPDEEGYVADVYAGE